MTCDGYVAKASKTLSFVLKITNPCLKNFAETKKKSGFKLKFGFLGCNLVKEIEVEVRVHSEHDRQSVLPFSEREKRKIEKRERQRDEVKVRMREERIKYCFWFYNCATVQF